VENKDFTLACTCRHSSANGMQGEQKIGIHIVAKYGECLQYTPKLKAMRVFQDRAAKPWAHCSSHNSKLRPNIVDFSNIGRRILQRSTDAF